MQDQQTRATVALKLLQASIAADNQDDFDFVSSVIDREQLYCCYTSDAGEAINNMAELYAEMERENPSAFSDKSGNGQSSGLRAFALASAGNIPLCNLSTEQRYALRMARAAHLR